MSKGYEKLDVYNRSFALAVSVHKFSQTLPQIEQYALADQMRRASKSICSNIAEGHAKSHYSKAEFKRFLFMAAGSSEEMRVWLKFCKELDYLKAEIWDKWDDEYDQISKMLNGLIRKL
ncbi:MAG: four helix bundle protein [Bdellovibrionales bacterium]